MTPTDPTTPAGLGAAEARDRLREFGPNEVAPAGPAGRLRLFAAAFLSPLTLILLVAGAVSAAVGEYASTAIIVLVVLTGSSIQFWQTLRSDLAIRKLREGVAVTATVRRDGAWVELPRREVVPGDLIRLAAGDLVPADARLVEARDLHVRQAALTGESLPVEKEPAKAAADGPASTDRPDLVFFGTSVVSGTATAVVTATGRATAFGDVAARLAARPPETEFDRG